jgi:hypothetical protein
MGFSVPVVVVDVEPGVPSSTAACMMMSVPHITVVTKRCKARVLSPRLMDVRKVRKKIHDAVLLYLVRSRKTQQTKGDVRQRKAPCTSLPFFSSTVVVRARPAV